MSPPPRATTCYWSPAESAWHRCGPHCSPPLPSADGTGGSSCWPAPGRPAELVFSAELEEWRERGAEVSVTVDRADVGWHGNVGVVTQLIDQARLDPAQTTALMCGPEVMTRITARALLAAGLAADRIRISLERNMQCGIAECGHCQLGPLLLCRDGPVLSYQVAEPLLETREL